MQGSEAHPRACKEVPVRRLWMERVVCGFAHNAQHTLSYRGNSLRIIPQNVVEIIFAFFYIIGELWGEHLLDLIYNDLPRPESSDGSVSDLATNNSRVFLGNEPERAIQPLREGDELHDIYQKWKANVHRARQEKAQQY